jgi:hypothetical protein
MNTAEATPTPNLNGPENSPLRQFVKSFMVVVTVYDLKTENSVREEVIDFGDYEHRKWLGKITYWAVSNGYSIETMSKADYDKQQNAK